MELLNATCPVGVSVGISQYLFQHLLSTVISSYCSLSSVYPKDQGEAVIQNGGEFDFIVIGAGSSGSVIANRLSEITDWKILLIEAGLDPPIESDIPALFAALQEGEYDWGYNFEKSNSSCGSSVYRECRVIRGKVMGGSSSVGLMIHIHGNPLDYDGWEKLGNPGWNYEVVSKYFEKIEHGYHKVESFPKAETLSRQRNEMLIKSFYNELGIPYINDINVKHKSGLFNPPLTIKNGVRLNTANAYLSPIKDRKNLIVMKETQVTRILIDTNKQAYGVEVFRNGVYKNITCTKEVIISAGVINSPQLLMLSGIGPREHLQDLNIKVVQDLKVGYNFQDHVAIPNMWIRFKDNASINEGNRSLNDIFYGYLMKKTRLGSLPGLHGYAYIDTSNGSVDYPDVHISHNLIESKFDLRGFAKCLNIRSDSLKHVLNVGKFPFFVFMYVLLNPKSKGRIYLNSTNPLDSPQILSGHLTEYDDVKTLIKAVKFIRKLSDTKAFKACCELFVIEPLNECHSIENSSDEYYECLIRNFAHSATHGVGTCKMGPASDNEAVVSPRLEVHGFKGLRVADASIMPNIVRANTSPACIVIGEKVADLIKEDWLKIAPAK